MGTPEHNICVVHCAVISNTKRATEIWVLDDGEKYDACWNYSMEGLEKFDSIY